MAGVESKGKELKISLPLVVFKKRKKGEHKALEEEEYKTICSYVKTDGLRDHVLKSLPFIDVHSLGNGGEKGLFIELIVRNSQQLTDVHEVAKKPSSGENTLSKCIHSYLDSLSLELQLGYELGTELLVLTVMTFKQLREGLIDFDDIDDDTDSFSCTANSGRVTHDSPPEAPNGEQKPNVLEAVQKIEMQSHRLDNVPREQGFNHGENLAMQKVDQQLVKQVSYVDKVLIVHVPVMGEFVSLVRLKSADKILNGKKLRPRGKETNMFQIQLTVPAANLQPVSYEYEINTCRYSFLKKFEVLSTTLTAGPYYINTEKIQRDIIGNFAFECIANHLEDIFFFHNIINIRNELEHIRTCIFEIDILLSGRSMFLNLDLFRQLIQILFGYMHRRSTTKAKILLLVVSGNLLKHVQCIKQIKEFNVDTCRQLLLALTDLHLNELPGSCQKYMVDLCQVLCEIHFGKVYSILRFMDMCYPFLNETHFDAVILGIRKCQRKLDFIGENGTDLIPAAIKLCVAMYGTHVESETPYGGPAQTLLKRLIYHLPTEYVLRIHAELSKKEPMTSSYESEFQLVLFDTVITSIEADVNESRETSNVKEICRIWMCIVNSGIEKPPKLINMFERETLDIVKNGQAKEINSAIKDFEVILHDKFLFECKASQCSLISALADSPIYSVHGLFIDCVNMDKYSTIFQERMLEHCKTWLLRSIRTHMQDYKCSEIHGPYIALSQLMSVTLIRTDTDPDLQSCLAEIVFKQLQKNQLTTILCQLDNDVENIKDEYVSELFKDHVVAMMKKKHKSQQPEELLFCFCSNGKLVVNSRITTTTVCLLLDEVVRTTDVKDNIEFFQNMVSRVEFWKMIFSGTGKCIQTVQSNESYKRAEMCVNAVTELLKRCELSYQLVDAFTLKSNREGAHCLLKLNWFESFEKAWKEANTLFARQLNDIAVAKKVLYWVNKYVPSANLPHGFKERVTLLEVFEENVKQNLLAVDLKNKATPIEIAELKSTSDLLEKVVHSKVFWNVSLSKVLDAISIKGPTERVDDFVEAVPGLFGESNCNDVDDQVLPFLDVTLDIGGKAFRKEWDSLMEDSELPMSSFVHMFKGANYKEEIEVAEKYLGKKIKAGIKLTLERMHELNKIANSVGAMKQSLRSCKIEDFEFTKDVESFEQLLTGDCSSYSFDQVSKSLGTVFEISKPLCEETISVLQAVGSASNLLEFLYKIVDEDIRNLIDAVEDISEQHVQETSVAALIEVKRFLQPVLKSSELHSDAKAIFELMNKQVVSNPVVANSIAVKIEDCINNLHNLISLYNNVANRSEQTKGIILNIVQRGKFHFTLNHEGTECSFKASYSVSKTKNSHSKPALVDFRSRALLLTNKYESTHGMKGHEFEIFVSYIDTCAEISDLVVTLHANGHTKYKTFAKAEDACSLVHLKDTLDSEHRKWCNHLTSIRTKYYLVNFLQGYQIHKLHSYLDIPVKPDYLEICESEAQTLLKAIHPDIQLLTLKAHFTQIKYTRMLYDEYRFLENIGIALHECLKESGLYERRLKAHQHGRKKRLGDLVQSGRLMVAQLEESSLLVVRTVLTLFCNTVERLPEPNQVLFCSRQTKWSEIDLLLNRCLGASEFYGKDVLYCVTNVELLSNELQFKFVEALRNIEPNRRYLFAVICRGSKHHPFIDELSDFVSKVRPLSDNIIEGILQSECPHVTTVTSEVAGLGKTTYIARQAYSCGHSVARLHISGPMSKDRIVNGLESLKVKEYNTLQIDIGSLADSVELDTFLFELIVLRFVSTGKTSICLPTPCVSIEIANSLQDSLRKSLQTAILFRRERICWKDYGNFIVSMEVNSPVQVACHFLANLEQCTLDTTDINFTGSHSVSAMPPGACRQTLRKYFPTCPGMSFSIVNIFLCVLADQLKKMSSSSFFRTSRIKDMLGHKTTQNIRSSLVQAMVDVSKDFSSRSVDACRNTQMLTVDVSKPSRTADQVTKRVEGMIRWEDSNHLMYVFHNQNIQTISPIYRDKTKVPQHIKTLFKSQMKKEMHDYKNMTQTELQIVLQKICRCNPLMIEQNKLRDLSKDYALTPDNLLKMILIMLRIKAGIPVLIMGETGCGKTSLLRYLAGVCEVQFDVLNVHAGVEENTIIDMVNDSNLSALKNTKIQHWLFFDEINTSEFVGLISDVICHNILLGQSLAPNLVVMGACNPYKLRSAAAISTAGLKGKVVTDELSRLVYRVLPLPEMLVDYVWDFGSLNEVDEKVYIRRMVEGVFIYQENYINILTDLLSMSQSFIRSHEDSSCSVSLRDVQRCKILTVWFYDTLRTKPTRNTNFETYVSVNLKEKAIILALAHCYHCRMSMVSVRKMYRAEIAEVFRSHGTHLKESDIYGVIKGEQDDILNRMDLPQGTAKNTALRENVFVLLVCILNKIPIFVVGKPGCSKSLSMQVIRNNLRGEDSKDPFFKTLPQLYCVSFQGSESSTSDGIVKVFEKAKKYQETNRADSVLSVVILDEIGLAEISKFNPLKVLHNLLEPDGKDRPNVAVVGISNWSLDASKMNRAIHLSRPEMDECELFDTGKSISDSFVEADKTTTQNGILDITRTQEISQFRTSFIEEDLKAIAGSYVRYTKKLIFQNFHGLRDFYSLVKYFAKEVSNKPNIDLIEKSDIMMTGLERNFGGLPSERHTMLSEFQIDELKQTCHVTSLIKSNVEDPMARHLMLVTTGESVLGILEQNLTEIGRNNREVIFGSQFEEDLTDDYNYRMLNRIILCMEQGLVLILKDLENIYGSLYDMLNQNYTIIGKKRHCRVALGPYSNPICHVAVSFRCIVLVDDSKLKQSDPPFLNRFEKQYLRFSDIIRPDQRGLIKSLEDWVKDISVCASFDEYDAFPIFSEDMISSLLLKHYRYDRTAEEITTRCKHDLLLILKPEVVVRLSEIRRDQMLNEAEPLVETYMSLPVHKGIKCLLESQLSMGEAEPNLNYGLMTMVFTNSNIHTKVLMNLNNFKKQVEKLGVFKSEKQLSARMQTFWLESSSDILFLQCSAVDDEQHIMLAKSVIEKFRQEYVTSSNFNGVKHVYFIVHLDRSKGVSYILPQINFLTSWKLVTLDSLEEPITALPDLRMQSLVDALISKAPLNDYIKEQLFWAFTRMKYNNGGRTVENLTLLLSKIKNSEDFLRVLNTLIMSWITRNNSDVDVQVWQTRVAFNRQLLHNASSFIDALEAFILDSIHVPLVKYLFVMETGSMTDTYFVEDVHSKERREIWTSLILQENEFSIAKVPDYSGPESYICRLNAVELKMPYSRFIFDTVESTSDEYLYSVKLLKSKLGLDSDDDLPDEILHKLQKKQELILNQRLPRLMKYNYTSALIDYFEDYCNLLTVQMCPRLTPSERIQYMKCILKENISISEKDLLEGITSVHIVVWNRMNVFRSHMKLFEACRDILIDDDIEKIISKKENADKYHGEGPIGTNNSLAAFDELSDEDTDHENDLFYENTDGEHGLVESSNQEGITLVGQYMVDTHATHNKGGALENDSSDVDPLQGKGILNNNNYQKDDVEMTAKCDITHHSGRLLQTYTNNVTEFGIEMLSDDGQVHGICQPLGTEQTELDQFELHGPAQIEPKMCKDITDSNDSLDHDIHDDTIETTMHLDQNQTNNEIDRLGEQLHIHMSARQVNDWQSNTHQSSLPSTDEEVDDDVDHEVDMKGNLVHIVCQKMLPTHTTIKYYENIKQWLIQSNVVLNLVAQVHPGSKYIHHLRICSDIVASLVIPLQLDYSSLFELADCIQVDDSFDTNNVYQAIIHIIDHAPAEFSLICQRILANYFLRCLLSNPTSQAIYYLMNLVCSNHLPDSNVAVFKPVLSLAFDYEREACEGFLFDILHNGVFVPVKSYDANSEEECDASVQEESFVTRLNGTIEILRDSGRVQCPFIVLLVDLVEDTFNHDINALDHDIDYMAPLLEDLIRSQTVIIDSVTNLQYLVACGFFKACISHVTSDIHMIDQKICEYINAILSKKTGNTISYTTESYILKMIGFEKRASDAQKRVNQLRVALPSLKDLHVQVTDSLTDCSIDRCPVLAFISFTLQDDIVVLNDHAASGSSDKIMHMINTAHKDEDLLLIAAYVERIFYIPRGYMVQNDNKKSYAIDIANHVRTSKLSERFIHFLECLIGTEDFRIVYLAHSEQTSSMNCLMNSFLVSLFSLILVRSGKQNDTAFFLNCFQRPLAVENCYIPGVPDLNDIKGKYMLSTLKNMTVAKFGTCECQHRIASFAEGSEVTYCPVCFKRLNTEIVYECKPNKTHSSSGFTSGNTIDPHYSVRELSPLACQVILLLIKGCLIGALGLNNIIPEQLEKVLHLNEAEIPKALWTDASLHWANIETLLGIGEHTVCIFLHTVLIHTKDLIFIDCVQMNSESGRMLWEKEFNQRIQYVLDNRFMLQKNMIKHIRSLGGDENILEDQLLEVDDDADDRLASIFRLRGKPSYDNFISELYPLRDRFPLLGLMISLKDVLQLPSHIKPMVMWHMAVVTTANYSMRKHDCLNMTATDFIQQAGDKDRIDILRTRFGLMQKSWSYLRKHLKDGITEDMIQMTGDLKMEHCIMYTKDCVQYRLLELLVRIQNDILDHILTLSERCESVRFLMRSDTMAIIPCVDITDVTQIHLLQFSDTDFKWNEVIEENAQNDTSYGHGQRIWYDFYAVEKLLARKLLCGKAYIRFNSMPDVVFTDELYKNIVSLSNDIKIKVKQTNLSSDVRTAIADRQREDPRIGKELLVQIGMIMTLLNKTGGDPNKCLMEYVDEMKNVLTKKFSEDLLPNPTSSIKLCHIISLYEVLEELNADTIIESLEDEFRIDLDIDQMSMFETMMKTKKTLGTYILSACKRFSNRCLSLREADATRPLIDYLRDTSFWPEAVLFGPYLRFGEEEELLDDVLPKHVLVKHIHHLVSLIETELEKERTESMSMSRLANSWQSSQKSVQVSKVTKQKMAATRRRKKFAV